MSDQYYKNQLYPLQDKVLKLIGQTHSDFYLTGGTLLSRYLLHHRYSDDLDFFINVDEQFLRKVSLAIKPVQENFSNLELSSMQEAYARYFVYDGDVKLKLEFVNDVKYHFGDLSRGEHGILLDSWENILSNKLSAIGGGNAAKDFVDILFISLTYGFNWEAMIDAARQEDAGINELDICDRFKKFDFSLLKTVSFPSEFDQSKITEDYFKVLARDSFQGFDNSLYGKNL